MTDQAGARLDRTATPSAADLADACRPEAHERWVRLTGWAERTYGIAGELLFFGRDSGWVLRFRRSGKALFTLLPLANGGFRALVVVGPTAWAAVADAELSVPIREAWAAARPYPDGRWLWPEVTDDAIVADIERLVTLKSPPRRPSATRVTRASRAGGRG